MVSIHHNKIRWILITIFLVLLITIPVAAYYLSASEGKLCGGLAANLPENQCPVGYVCRLEGNYPDAGGKCTNIIATFSRKPASTIPSLLSTPTPLPSKPTTNDENPNDESPPMVNWKIYISKDYEYSINYPPTWTVVAANSGATFYPPGVTPGMWDKLEPPNPANHDPSININIVDQPFSDSLGKTGKLFIREPEEITVNGIKGYYYQSLCPGGCPPKVDLSYKNGEKIVNIYFFSQEKDSIIKFNKKHNANITNVDEKTFLQMLSTFRLLNQQQTYINTAYGYAITYPSNWSIKDMTKIINASNVLDSQYLNDSTFIDEKNFKIELSVETNSFEEAKFHLNYGDALMQKKAQITTTTIKGREILKAVVTTSEYDLSTKEYHEIGKLYHIIVPLGKYSLNIYAGTKDKEIVDRILSTIYFLDEKERLNPAYWKFITDSDYYIMRVPPQFLVSKENLTTNTAINLINKTRLERIIFSSKSDDASFSVQVHKQLTPQQQDSVFSDYSPSAKQEITETVIDGAKAKKWNGLTGVAGARNHISILLEKEGLFYEIQFDGNLEVFDQILQTFKFTDQATYTCPAAKTIDCMPIVDKNRKHECDPSYLRWVQIYCPDITITQ